MWEKIAKIMSKLPVMVFVAAILVASFVVMTVPAANALMNRNYYYLNDNPITARTGNTAVCGDHICAPGEWDKLITSLSSAQRGNQAGWTAKSTTTTPANSAPTTSNATAPTYPPTPSTPSSSVSPAVCNSIENMLTTAGVSDSVVSQVMTDLGCSYK